MNAEGLNRFLSGDFLTILAAGVIVLIMKHWKDASWQKILVVLVIAYIIKDFALDHGKLTFKLISWFFGLFNWKI
ncbi:TcpD family membrane protein [Enterococcus faecalis]|uniref:TcpD family membrane protein n=1 Tax=Enterococcus faecalis TaxID=1351 RepID=UPI002DBFB5D6|nr:TcpD family membrane protein [Enterococcus faecalis]MEB7428444.1 TcpD family membrane protein [Enterococcus faecalis]